MTSKPRILTGITPSGIPHLGNYKGMFEPMIELANKPRQRIILHGSDYFIF